jgi:hypothetical protein
MQKMETQTEVQGTWGDVAEILKPQLPMGWQIVYSQPDGASLKVVDTIEIAPDFTVVGDYAEIMDGSGVQMYATPIAEPASEESQVPVKQLVDLCAKLAAALVEDGYDVGFNPDDYPLEGF